MEDIRVQIPNITIEQKKLILKALEYYRLSAVEFSYASDETIFNSTVLMDIIEYQSKLVNVND